MTNRERILLCLLGPMLSVGLFAGFNDGRNTVQHSCANVCERYGEVYERPMNLTINCIRKCDDFYMEKQNEITNKGKTCGKVDNEAVEDKGTLLPESTLLNYKNLTGEAYSSGTSCGQMNSGSSCVCSGSFCLNRDEERFEGSGEVE